MGGPGGWRGLARSAFLADITLRDRDPARIAATVIGGICVGLVAGVACWILVLVPYTFLAGLGREGLLGLGKVAVKFQDPDAHDLGITVLRLVASTATDGVFPLAFVALAAIITNRPFQHYVTVALRVRWRLVVIGLALTAAAMTPLVLADRMASPGAGPPPLLDITADWGGRAIYLLSALLLVPAAAAEELMFRGWLLRQLAAFTRNPAILIVVTALAFAAAHFDFSPDAFLTRSLMGAGFAYMTLRLGGIELSTGAHAANNILIVLFIEPLSTAAPSASSAVSPGVGFEDMILIAGYVLITEAVVRFAPLRDWAGVKLGEIAPPLSLGRPA
ncbi:MAG TPA: type II CAAX endopeptidase family protein [Caulobacteraceae bacterium]|nr:type II CAAX endopeptidase family protein [Caulobacteraceae bacterium]